MRAIRYRYGVDEHGVIADVFDLLEEDRADFICLGCEKIIRPVLPQTDRQKHFRHKHEIECSEETYLHRAGKLLFEQTYRKCLKDGEPFDVYYEVPRTCEGCSMGPCEQEGFARKFDLTSAFKSISVEERDDGFIPDLLLKTDKGEKLYIEIAVTYGSSFKKIDSNARIIEFYINSEEDFEYLKETSLRYDEHFLQFYNFNPEPIVHQDRSYCSREIDYFVVHRSGKCVIKSVNAVEFEKIKKGPALYVNDLRYSGYGVFISELEKAMNSGVRAKNCYACRYHADANYTFELFATESKPIFCKTYKFKCRSNHAAECDRYRPDMKVFEDRRKNKPDY